VGLSAKRQAFASRRRWRLRALPLDHRT